MRALLVLLLLTGCATTQGPVDVQYVDRPVPVPCVTTVPVPPKRPNIRVGAPVDKNTAEASLFIIDADEYIKRADAALRACAEAP